MAKDKAENKDRKPVERNPVRKLYTERARLEFELSEFEKRDTLLTSAYNNKKRALIDKKHATEKQLTAVNEQLKSHNA